MALDEVICRVIEKSNKNFDLEKFKMSIEALDYNDPMYKIKRHNRIGGSNAHEEDHVIMCMNLRPIIQ